MARVDVRRIGFFVALAGLSFSLFRCTSFAGLNQPEDGGASSRDGNVPTTDGPVGSGEDAGGGNDGSSSGDPCQAAADYRSAIIADKPYAYFRFDNDGGGTIRDEMGGVAVCSPGGAIVQATGVFPCSTAVQLAEAGGSHLSCSGNFAFPAKAAFSIEGWISPDVIDVDGYRRVATNQTSVNRSGYDLYVEDGPQGKKLVFELFANGTNQCTNITTIATGRWSYILATYDGNQTVVRVNEESNSSTCGGGAGLGTQLVLGADTAKEAGHFVGKMDEIAIYNFALPKARADAHFKLGPRL